MLSKSPLGFACLGVGRLDHSGVSVSVRRSPHSNSLQGSFSSRSFSRCVDEKLKWSLSRVVGTLRLVVLHCVFCSVVVNPTIRHGSPIHDPVVSSTRRTQRLHHPIEPTQYEQSVSLCEASIFTNPIRWLSPTNNHRRKGSYQLLLIVKAGRWPS